MRILLDTNVVVSALLWRGTPYRMLQAIRQQQHVQLFCTAAMLTELADVLSRPTLAGRLSHIGRNIGELLAYYNDAVELVTPPSIQPIVAADPDDDQVIAAAVAAAADVIVSGDHHWLALASHRGIRIVTPADASTILAGEDGR